MNTTESANVQALRSVSGAPLTLLCAFAIAAADLVAMQWLRAATTLSQDTIGREMPGLEALGLVEQVKRYAWRLTPRGQVAAAQARVLLSSLTPQIAESTPATHQPALPLLDSPSSLTPQIADSSLPGAVGARAGAFEEGPEYSSESNESANSGVTAPSSSSIYISKQDSYSADDGRLAWKFGVALKSARVYSQMRSALAQALIAEGGPYWLGQVLAWIAQTTAEGVPEKKRGGIIYPALTGRGRADDLYIPPGDLTFTEALAWAENGGESPPAADPEPEPRPLPGVTPPSVPAPATAESELWARALEQIAFEVPKSTFATWLAPARLVRIEGDTCVVAAPNAFARDWLANRMATMLSRTLEGLTGGTVKLAFEVMQTHPQENT